MRKAICSTAAVVIMLLTNCTVNSQTLFVENFHYPVRDSLENIGGWALGGINSPYNVKITSSGLNYSGYSGSGIGNAVTIVNHDNGEFVNHSFDEKTSGYVYMSFLLRVDSLSPNSTESYNLCFDPSAGATGFVTRAYIKRLSSTTFKIGVAKMYNPVYSTVTYNKGVTYLVVLKHRFVAGANNDTSKIYVFNSGVPATEPAVPSAMTTNGIDPLNIGEVSFNNSYISSGFQGSITRYDGIKVGTTWTNTLFGSKNYQLTMNALLEGFYNPATNKMRKDTGRVYVRYDFPPYSIVDSSKALIDSLGKGVFALNHVANNTGYYLSVKHRNSIETWTYYSYQFGNYSMTYNFIPSPGNSYGENMTYLDTGKYGFYGGDVNQDGTVDLTDIVEIFNGTKNFLTGYVRSDVTGDNYVDLSDLTLAFNNSNNFVCMMRP